MSEIPSFILVISKDDLRQVTTHRIVLIGSKNISTRDHDPLNLENIGTRLFWREKIKWLSLYLNWHYQLDILGANWINNYLFETSSQFSAKENERMPHSLHSLTQQDKNQFLTRYLTFLKDNVIVPRILLPMEAYVVAFQSLKHWLEEEGDVAVLHELALKLHSMLAMRQHWFLFHAGFITLERSHHDAMRQLPEMHPLIVANQRDVDELAGIGLLDADIAGEIMNLLMKTLLRYDSLLGNLLNYGFLVEQAWKLASYLEWLAFHPDSK